MRYFPHLFCVILLSLSALPLRAATDRTEVPPVPTSQNAPVAPQSQAVTCLDSAYQHYLQSGITPQNAWNDAVRDCQNGVDPACIQRAQQHYIELGESPNTAWSNAVRDCRTVAPSVGVPTVPISR